MVVCARLAASQQGAANPRSPADVALADGAALPAAASNFLQGLNTIEETSIVWSHTDLNIRNTELLKCSCKTSNKTTKEGNVEQLRMLSRSLAQLRAERGAIKDSVKSMFSQWTSSFSDQAQLIQALAGQMSSNAVPISPSSLSAHLSSN